MLAVSGVGENKFSRYGEAFLTEIADFTHGKREKLYFGDKEELEAVDEEVSEERRRKKAGRKEEFYLTKEQAAEFPYREKYFAAEFAEQLNLLRDEGKVRKTSGAEIFRRMQARGYAREERRDGRWIKTITEEGEAFGLTLGTRVSKKGTDYEDIFYEKKAQREILSWFVKGNEDL